MYNNCISFENHTIVIAEAGVNHNGDVALARQLVEKAKECGADCIKFQTFKAERLAVTNAPKAEYQLHTTAREESQVDMLKALELPESAYPELIQLCSDIGIDFLSTPYDMEDIDFLDGLGVSAFKVASGQAVEPYFLRYMARKGKPVFLSTGMCTLGEVDEAVRIIRDEGNDNIVILQCTTNYPSRIEDCNLLAMQKMGQALNVSVGYSDHTQSLTAAIVAVGLGACVIERHFTLDKTMPGPDQSSSSDPREFKQFVNWIREAEASLGTGIKIPCETEKINAPAMRRSLVAKTDIPAGTVLNWENLTLKRPGTGLLGNAYDFIKDRKAKVEILKDSIITLDMVE